MKKIISLIIAISLAVMTVPFTVSAQSKNFMEKDGSNLITKWKGGEPIYDWAYSHLCDGKFDANGIDGDSTLAGFFPMHIGGTFSKLKSIEQIKIYERFPDGLNGIKFSVYGSRKQGKLTVDDESFTEIIPEQDYIFQLSDKAVTVDLKGEVYSAVKIVITGFISKDTSYTEFEVIGKDYDGAVTTISSYDRTVVNFSKDLNSSGMKYAVSSEILSNEGWTNDLRPKWLYDGDTEHARFWTPDSSRDMNIQPEWIKIENPKNLLVQKFKIATRVFNLSARLDFKIMTSEDDITYTPLVDLKQYDYPADGYNGSWNFQVPLYEYEIPETTSRYIKFEFSRYDVNGMVKKVPEINELQLWGLSDTPVKIKDCEVISDIADKFIKVEMRIYNPDIDNKNVLMAVCVSDEKNQLVSVKPISAILVGGKTTSFETEMFTVPEVVDGYKIKVFTYSDLSKFKGMNIPLYTLK